VKLDPGVGMGNKLVRRFSENRESRCCWEALRMPKSDGKSSGTEPDIGGLGARGSPPGTLGEEEASAVVEVETAVVKLVKAVASMSSIWVSEALLLVYLPRGSLSLGRFEVSLDIDMAA
jgi:hypothetical protein